MEEYEFEVLEMPEKLCVAGGSSKSFKDVQKEAAHYAMQYAQDGPVKVILYKVKREQIDTYDLE